MNKLEILRLAAVSLAVVGLMLPSAALGTPPALAFPSQPTRSVSDIALDETGALNGRVVDAQGRGIANIPLQIGRDGQVVASTVTGSRGQFTARQLVGGVYDISTPNGQATYRIWPANAAPPIAARSIQITDGQIIRGQCRQCKCADGDCAGSCGGCTGSAGWGFSSRGGCGFAGCDSCCKSGMVGKPWLIAAGIAAAIAIPLALDDDDAS
jgi:hypothetical protein